MDNRETGGERGPGRSVLAARHDVASICTQYKKTIIDVFFFFFSWQNIFCVDNVLAKEKYLFNIFSSVFALNIFLLPLICHDIHRHSNKYLDHKKKTIYFAHQIFFRIDHINRIFYIEISGPHTQTHTHTHTHIYIYIYIYIYIISKEDDLEIVLFKNIYIYIFKDYHTLSSPGDLSEPSYIYNPRSSHTKDLKNGTWYPLA